jgi:hypothetical protein
MFLVNHTTSNKTVGTEINKFEITVNRSPTVKNNLFRKKMILVSYFCDSKYIFYEFLEAKLIFLF